MILSFMLERLVWFWMGEQSSEYLSETESKDEQKPEHSGLTTDYYYYY